MTTIMRVAAVFALVIASAVIFYLFTRHETEKSVMPFSTIMFQLTSSAFEQNGAIPPRYTCDGKNISPQFEIRGAPEETQSFVLTMDDPDAPGDVWVHWVAYNIPPTTRVIEEGKEPEGIPGKNSWGRTGYGGPCPPRGTHRYIFILYALDAELALPEGSAKKEVLEAFGKHFIAETELVGFYERK